MLFSKLVRLSAAVLVTAGEAMALGQHERMPDYCKNGICGTTAVIVKTGPSATYTILNPIFSTEPTKNLTTVLHSTITVLTTSTTIATLSSQKNILPRDYSLSESSELQGYGNRPSPTLSSETPAESTATATETSWVSAVTSTDVDVSSTSLPALSLTSTSEPTPTGGSSANVTTAETTPVVTSATLLKSTVPGLTIPSSGSQTSSKDGSGSETSPPASPSSTPYTGSGRATRGSPNSLVMAVMCASLLSIALAFVVVG